MGSKGIMKFSEIASKDVKFEICKYSCILYAERAWHLFRGIFAHFHFNDKY